MSKEKTPESFILSECLSYLETRNIYHWRNNVGAVRLGPRRFTHFGKKGSSDILGVLPDGKFLAVECKSRNGRLSPEQKQFLEALRERGAIALVVRGWCELDNALREAGYTLEDMPLFHACSFGDQQ